MNHILLVLLLFPILGSIFLAFLPSHFNKTALRIITVILSLITLILSISLLWFFDPNITQVQFLESYAWNKRMGTTFSLGVDGISLPMVILAALLCFIAILASSAPKLQTKGYYLLMLLLEGAMLGVFMAQDWSLFYIFWELTLIPLLFLIDGWGGKKCQGAALNFVLYTMGGSVFMLLSLLVLFDAVPGHSFSMIVISEGAKTLSQEQQIWIFLGFLVGFGVKMPIFPIHGWLPVAHVEAPSPVSILLSGILLKMGAYGLIRVVGFLPEAVLVLQNFLMALGCWGIIYGGLLAWRQTDLKGMIAYSSVSHMGVVLVGIATLSVIGLTGALMQMVAHGFVAGMLFLLIGLLYERTGTREINDYSSLVQVTPKFAILTTLAFLASVGMPGTAGFIAELHILIAGFERWGWWIILLSLGVLISATYAARTVGKLFTGPVRPAMEKVPDLKTSEWFAASILALGVIIFGFYPTPLLNLISPSVQQFIIDFYINLRSGL